MIDNGRRYLKAHIPVTGWSVYVPYHNHHEMTGGAKQKQSVGPKRVISMSRCQIPSLSWTASI